VKYLCPTFHPLFSISCEIWSAILICIVYQISYIKNFMTRQPWWTNSSSLSRLQFHTELDTTHSVGLLWTSNRPVAEISNWQNTTLIWERHPCAGGIRTRNPSKRAAADPRPRLHGHRNWRYIKLLIKNLFPRLYCMKVLFCISFNASFPESGSINILNLYCKHYKYKNTLSNNSIERIFLFCV